MGPALAATIDMDSSFWDVWLEKWGFAKSLWHELPMQNIYWFWCVWTASNR